MTLESITVSLLVVTELLFVAEVKIPIMCGATENIR